MANRLLAARAAIDWFRLPIFVSRGLVQLTIGASPPISGAKAPDRRRAKRCPIRSSN
jgi:hypothetical protein